MSSGSSNRTPKRPTDIYVPDSTEYFENVSAYISGKKFNHTKLLLLYSVAAATYHIVLALHLLTPETISPESWFRIARESSKFVACIFLGLFGMWMSHVERRIRYYQYACSGVLGRNRMALVNAVRSLADEGINNNILWNSMLTCTSMPFVPLSLCLQLVISRKC
jgi:hypothetical protein